MNFDQVLALEQLVAQVVGAQAVAAEQLVAFEKVAVAAEQLVAFEEVAAGHKW